MGFGQPRVTPHHRLEPAALQHERQPELLAFGQPQRAGQGVPPAGDVAAGVTEPGVGQACGQPVRFRQVGLGREDGREHARRLLAVPGGRPGVRERDPSLRRGAGPFGGRHRGADISRRRPRTRLQQAQPLVEPRRDEPVRPGLGDDLHGQLGAALSQGTAGRDQVGHRPDQLVRTLAERGVGLLEEAARLGQLAALQVHPGERDQRGGGRARAGQPLLPWPRDRLAGQLRSAGQPATQRLGQRQRPGPVGSFGLPAGADRTGQPGLQDLGRLLRAAGPQIDRGPADLHAPAEIRIPGGPRAAGDLVEHRLGADHGGRRRGQLPGVQRRAEADHRGGQPPAAACPAGRPSSRWSAASSAAVHDSCRPAPSASAAQTR